MDCWCKAWPIALAPRAKVVVEHDPVFGPLNARGRRGGPEEPPPALPSNLTSNTAEAHLLLQQAIAEGATSLDTQAPSCKRMANMDCQPGALVIWR